jgi:hypothetical protein
MTTSLSSMTRTLLLANIVALGTLFVVGRPVVLAAQTGPHNWTNCCKSSVEGDQYCCRNCCQDNGTATKCTSSLQCETPPDQ